MTQLDMFPELPTPDKSPPRVRSANGIVYMRRKIDAAHVHCHDCIDAIHHLGVSVAPPPNSARWIRREGDARVPLCHTHKDERYAQEQA